MKIFSVLSLAAFILLTALNFSACSSKTSGSKAIANKTEFELKDSVIVGKTTRREVYAMYGEPTKNFGKVSANAQSNASAANNLTTAQQNAMTFAYTLRNMADGMDEPADESHKITDPKTTSLVVYSYAVRKTNSAKRYIPVAGNFMSVDSNTDMKAFYIGFDDNDVVTERWYSHTKSSGSNRRF